MSIIESAFLKTLKESKSELGESEKKDAVKMDVPSHVNYDRSSPHRESARKNISRMSQAQTFTPQELNKKGIITIGTGESNLVNEYRNLRTKLLAINKSRNFSILVTSVSPNHDISKIAVNIAATFALDSGKTSLLINANSHTNEIDDLFEVKSKYGIVDLVDSESVNLDDVILETGIPRLRYISFGSVKESSAEYFSSTTMQESINSILSRYPERYPIISAPSIASSADTRILIGLCDFVVLVIPYGKCSEDNIKQAMLTVGGEKFAGVILDEF